MSPAVSGALKRVLRDLDGEVTWSSTQGDRGDTYLLDSPDAGGTRHSSRLTMQQLDYGCLGQKEDVRLHPA